MSTTERTGDEAEARDHGPAVSPRGTFSSLVHRDYRYLWLANLAATFAMQMSGVARGWIVYALTGSAVRLALVTIAFLAPTIVFSLLGGVLADRVPKKPVMIAAQTLNCVTTVLLALIVYRGTVEFWHFVCFALFNGTVFAIAMPARQAMIPQIVGERFLFNAIALSSASFNLSRVFGPTVAGATLGWVAGGDVGSHEGVGIVFFVIAGLYGLSALATACLRERGLPPEREQGSILSELFSGVAHIAGDRVLRALFLVAFVATMFGMPMQFLMPAFSTEVLGGGPDDLGMLMGAMGVGAIVASFALARMGEVGGKGWFLLGAAFAWGAATLWFAVAPDLSAALPRAALCGLASSAFMSLNNSLIQLSVSTELRGRVMSAVMLMWGLMPLGVVPVSFLAERVGIAGALSASGAVLLLCVGLAALLLPALRRIDQGYRDEDLVEQAQRVDEARPSAGPAGAVRPPGGGQGER